LDTHSTSNTAGVIHKTVIVDGCILDVKARAVKKDPPRGIVVLLRHWTHLFVAPSQTGVAPEQVLLSVHCTQAPVLEHAGCVASAVLHWATVLQAPLLFVVVQMGEVPAQFKAVKHWTHLLVTVSHTAVAPEQLVLAVRWTHAPAVEQTGWVTSMPAHWEEPVQTVHVPALEQMGVEAGQVALVRQPMQVLLVEQKVCV
jgi:hypothetical protein